MDFLIILRLAVDIDLSGLQIRGGCHGKVISLMAFSTKLAIMNPLKNGISCSALPPIRNFFSPPPECSFTAQECITMNIKRLALAAVLAIALASKG